MLVEDHTDDFFCDQVLRGLARDLRLTEQALNESITLQQHVDANRILQLYERLVRIFTAKGCRSNASCMRRPPVKATKP
mgnify:CR=1 FL=1